MWFCVVPVTIFSQSFFILPEHWLLHGNYRGNIHFIYEGIADIEVIKCLLRPNLLTFQYSQFRTENQPGQAMRCISFAIYNIYMYIIFVWAILLSGMRGILNLIQPTGTLKWSHRVDLRGHQSSIKVVSTQLASCCSHLPLTWPPVSAVQHNREDNIDQGRTQIHYDGKGKTAFYKRRRADRHITIYVYACASG